MREGYGDEQRNRLVLRREEDLEFYLKKNKFYRIKENLRVLKVKTKDRDKRSQSAPTWGQRGVPDGTCQRVIKRRSFVDRNPLDPPT